ncbi:MAG: tetratricopeptide repeat protein [Bacteroidia bacterium]|nr:tetratricopeptide repeat protein [Bacteroidia bacterium]
MPFTLKVFLFYCFIMWSLSCSAGNKYDSLANALKIETLDKKRLEILTQMVKIIYFSESKKAVLPAQEAIYLSTRLKDFPSLASLYKMYGTAEYFGGKHDHALELYFGSVHIYDSLNMEEEKAGVFNEIGTLYKKNGRLDDAFEIFSKAKEIFKKYHNLKGEATSVNNIGIVYEMQDKLDKALASYFYGLDIYKKINDHVGESYSCENIGGVYLMKKQYTQSEVYLKRSLELRLKADIKQAVAFSYFYLGELFSGKGDYILAKENYILSLIISKEIGYSDLIQSNYKTLSDINRKLGNYKQALEYNDLGSRLKDSIFNEDKSRQLIEMQTKYEVESTNKENLLLSQSAEIQKQQVEIQTEQSRNKSLVIYSIALFTVLLFLGSMVYYKRKQQSQKIETELSVRRAEEIQRSRISQDLHDNLGSQLTYVVTNLGWMESSKDIKPDEVLKIKAVGEMSRQAIHTLRETVWALNSESIAIDAFYDKFKVYAIKMAEFNKSLELVFNENIEVFTVIKPNDALNLFRMCQEIFNNSLKHSEAKSIKVSISSDVETAFRFILTDDGIGFDAENPDKEGHYGMQNLRKRAADSNAEIKLKSSIGNGSETQIVVLAG